MTSTDDVTELWENATEASTVVRKIGADGSMGEERVQGGRKLHITPRDRKINQEICADESMDPFLNGMLVPVRLITDEDRLQFANNPNVMDKEEMRKLIKGHAGTFATRLGEVTNVITVKHWIEIAKEADAPYKRVQALEGRLAQLKPSGSVSSVGKSADTA
jgi:hypothetical protein